MDQLFDEVVVQDEDFVEIFDCFEEFEIGVILCFECYCNWSDIEELMEIFEKKDVELNEFQFGKQDKMNDFVCMYLCEMGIVFLFDCDGEVEIVQCFECGEWMIYEVFCDNFVVFKELLCFNELVQCDLCVMCELFIEGSDQCFDVKVVECVKGNFKIFDCIVKYDKLFQKFFKKQKCYSLEGDCFLQIECEIDCEFGKIVKDICLIDVNLQMCNCMVDFFKEIDCELGCYDCDIC